jgi:CRISPR-associated protein Cmr2
MISLYNDKEKSLPGTLGYQLRQARIECGDGMKFDWNNDKPVPKDAAAATVLRIFEHKDKSDNLKSLLNGSNSIKRLSDELIVAKQIADVKKILLFEEDIK